MREKRGQVAIFVIVALLLMGAIVLFFVLRTGPTLTVGQVFETQAFLGQCLRPEIQKTIDDLLANGGFAEPKDTTLYQDKKIVYLCKNINYYQPCVMQHPRYIEEVRLELQEQLMDDIENCFNLLGEELTTRGFTRSSGDFTYEAVSKPGIVELEIMQNLTISKDGLSQSYEKFIIISRSPFYDLISVAHEIARQEAQFCYFENLGYSLLYRDIEIKKDVKSDSTKIYTLEHKETGKELMIAIRGCAIPAGF